MLRVTEIKASEAAISYYTDPRSADYYLAAHERRGVWEGIGALKLGLTGPVGRVDFERLCRNQNPKTAARLTPITRGNRRVGYDMTFNAVKSVSVLFSLTRDEAILNAHQEAVHETMVQMEVEMKARVRENGQNHDRTTANMICAVFPHLTSRPALDKRSKKVLPDPHMHSHAVTFNATWDHSEGKWKAGQFGDLKRDASYFEACYHNRLARKMQNLGYSIIRTKTAWEIEGIGREIIEKFSNRTVEVHKAANGKDLSTAQLAALGKITRRSKSAGEKLTESELRELWLSRLTRDEVGELLEVADLAKLRRRYASAPDESMKAVESVNHAIAHTFERKSVETERMILSKAIRHAIGSACHETVEKAFENSDILSYGEADRIWCTTAQVLGEERRFIDFCRAGRNAHEPFRKSPGQIALKELSAEQRSAAVHILSSCDAVTAIRGRAGTGKTTMMSATIQGLEQAGHVVRTYAPTSDAAKNTLRKEGFKDSQTLQKLLANKEMQREAAGSILWIDEAGLISSRQMAALADVAEQYGCRIILSGDTGQHAPVERGDALRILESHGGLVSASLETIYRQRDRDYKEAVHLLASGYVDASIEKLSEMNAIKELPFEERYLEMARDYVSSVSDGTGEMTALCVSPTHAEAELLTHCIRTLLKAQNPGGENSNHPRLTSLGFTEAEKTDPANYTPGYVIQTLGRRGRGGQPKQYFVKEVSTEGISAQDSAGKSKVLDLTKIGKFEVYRLNEIELMRGDRIRITRNGKSLEGEEIENGTLHTVNGFGTSGEILLDDGKSLAHDFGHLTHGYCVTSHASQGKTVDTVLIAESSTSFSAASLEQMYVSISRGRRKVKIYTDDQQSLKEAIKRSHSRRAASDFLWNPRRFLQSRRRPSLMQRAVCLSNWVAGVIAEISTPNPELLPKPNTKYTIGNAHER